ncbi:MAG: Tn3 family transposase, partial [Bacteroidota bacterium]
FFETYLFATILEQAAVFAKRHNHSVYLFRSLLHYFHNHRIILPAYSFLQRQIISPILRAEQHRLEQIIANELSKAERALLDALLEKPEEGMYLFTQLQKEPSSFQYYQIRAQLKYAAQLKQIYKIVLRLYDQMGISNENIRYYGQLAQDHTPFRLQQLKSRIRYVYLLCFAYNRYRFINDILVEALKYNVLGLEQSAVEFATQSINHHQFQANSSLSKVPRVLGLLNNQSLSDELPFGKVRKMAFAILSHKEIDLVTDLIEKNKPDKKQLIGAFYKKRKRLISLYLRPIAIHFELNNAAKCDAIVAAISFMNQQVQAGKSFSKLAQDEFPIAFLSKKQKKLILDEQGLIDLPKYEMALYQILRNKIESGDIFVSDSFKNRSFEQDLIDSKAWNTTKVNIIKSVDLPKLNKSVGQILEQWKALIEPLYKRVNDRIQRGLNPSVQLDGKHKDGSTKWHLVYTQTSNPLNHDIYQQFTPIDIASLLQLVDEHTDFLSAFTHLFPSNVSRKVDKHKLIACLVAFGTNYGIGQMASISDMSYQELATTANSLIYLETLQQANSKIVNQTITLPMYQHYKLEPDVVHSSSDGQKYYTQIPTINSRYSPKYFGLAKGISSLTTVADYIPINAQIIGANEHESHYVFDLLYNNDTRIKPDIHSTDSHGINQVNFAILDMFGYRFAPRYKDISSKVKTIYSFQAPSLYQDYVIKPIRKFKEDLIEQEWDSFQRIIVSLAQKHTTQSTIIKKLSSFKRNNAVRKAIVEYNAIVETYHKLSYIDDPKFQKQIQTSLNRGEHINKLRKHYFHANGGKFKVHTVMEQKIWSECNRLLANATIYYNTWLLSELLKHYKDQNKLTQVELIKKVSPIAWQHIHIHGRYTFKIGKLLFNIKEMVHKVEI